MAPPGGHSYKKNLTKKYSKVTKICSACADIFLRVSYMFKPTVYSTPSKKHYGNEVHLTGQNLPTKCCQSLDFWYTFLKVQIFQFSKYRVCRLKVFKVTSCQSWRSQEKVCHAAPALVKPLGPSSSCTGVKSISKFDGW